MLLCCSSYYVFSLINTNYLNNLIVVQATVQILLCSPLAGQEFSVATLSIIPPNAVFLFYLLDTPVHLDATLLLFIVCWIKT